MRSAKVFIRSFGCQMNSRDSEIIAGLMKKEGFRIVDSDSKADVVIFNTCSVRQHAEDKVWSEIGRLKNSDKIIGVAGCMGQNHKEAVFERAPAVDFVTGPSDIHKIPEIVARLIRHGKGPGCKEGLLGLKIWETEDGVRPEAVYHSGYYEDKEHAFVVISEGCENHCSYCVVPKVRGILKHRRHAHIIKEIEEAVKSGLSTFTLLGQNVNAYDDGEVDFIGLLKKTAAVPGVRELGFITSHPKDASNMLFETMRDLPVLKKYLHLPVQAGSDKILAAMNRGYTSKMYLDLIDNYRKIIPKAVLTSDIIVGFPGETESDFQKTYDLVKQAEFDAAFIFKYSPRPHTEAARLVDDVPVAEKQKRHAKILDLQRSISKKKGKRSL